MLKEPPKSSNSLFYAIIFLIIGFVVGGFIAVQITTTRTIARSTNPVQPALELADTIDNMKVEQAELKSRIIELRADVDKKEDVIESRRSTSKELTGELTQFKKIVGLTAMYGEGVVIKLDDGNYEGLKDRNDFKNDAIIHSTDILDIINMLWAAGAEAIAVNNERVVSTTSINCIVNTILVNESHVGTPLEIKAIGDKAELASFMKDPGRLIDLHERQNDYGLIFEVSEEDEVILDSYSGTYEI